MKFDDLVLDADLRMENGAVTYVRVPLTPEIIADLVVAAVAHGAQLQSPFRHRLRWTKFRPGEGPDAGPSVEVILERVAEVVPIRKLAVVRDRGTR